MSTRIQGIGIGLRREHYSSILASSRRIDWLEIVPENFVERDGRGMQVLRACAERWGVLAHGVSLSLGGPDPFDRDYLRGLKRLLDELGAPFYTDHLCYAAIDGAAFHDLLPLPFTEEAAMHAAARIRQVADVLERPVAVENITYYAQMPGGSLTEGEWVSAVVEEADCGLLLDLNNVYVNAVNHGDDPFATLGALPLARAWQVHLAGYSEEANGRLLDDHSTTAHATVLALYERVLEQLGPVPTLFEWDTKIPAIDVVIDEADRAREVAERVLRRRAGASLEARS